MINIPTNLVNWATTNQMGLLWLATTVSVSTAKFVDGEEIDFKKIANHMLASFLMLLVTLLLLSLVDWMGVQLA